MIPKLVVRAAVRIHDQLQRNRNRSALVLPETSWQECQQQLQGGSMFHNSKGVAGVGAESS